MQYNKSSFTSHLIMLFPTQTVHPWQAQRRPVFWWQEGSASGTKAYMNERFLGRRPKLPQFFLRNDWNLMATLPHEPFEWRQWGPVDRRWGVSYSWGPVGVILCWSLCRMCVNAGEWAGPIEGGPGQTPMNNIPISAPNWTYKRYYEQRNRRPVCNSLSNKRANSEHCAEECSGRWHPCFVNLWTPHIPLKSAVHSGPAQDSQLLSSQHYFYHVFVFFCGAKEEKIWRKQRGNMTSYLFSSSHPNGSFEQKKKKIFK